MAANHESLLDPPLLVLAARQPLHFLAKVELWRYRPGAWLMDALGGIPIRRDRRDLLGRARRRPAARGRDRRALPAGHDPGRRLDARRRAARPDDGSAARPRSDRRHKAPSRTAGSRSRRSGSSSASRSRSSRRSRPSRRRGGSRAGAGPRRRGPLAGPYAVTDATRTSARVRLRRPAGAACRSGRSPCLPAARGRPLRPYRLRLTGVLGLILFSSILGAIPRS